MTSSRFGICRSPDGLWRVLETATGATAHYDGIKLERLSLIDADDLARTEGRELVTPGFAKG